MSNIPQTMQNDATNQIVTGNATTTQNSQKNSNDSKLKKYSQNLYKNTEKWLNKNMQQVMYTQDDQSINHAKMQAQNSGIIYSNIDHLDPKVAMNDFLANTSVA